MAKLMGTVSTSFFAPIEVRQEWIDGNLAVLVQQGEHTILFPAEMKHLNGWGQTVAEELCTAIATANV